MTRRLRRNTLIRVKATREGQNMKRNIGDRLEHDGELFRKIEHEAPDSCQGCAMSRLRRDPSCVLDAGVHSHPQWEEVEDGGTDCHDSIWCVVEPWEDRK